MSRLNLAHLAVTFTLIHTVNEVFRDPAVVKAAKQFREDGAQAFRSGGALVREAQSSWRRHSPQTNGAGTDE